MKFDYEKTVDKLVKEMEFTKTFHIVTLEVLLSMIKDLYSKGGSSKIISLSGLAGFKKEKKELDIRKLFDERFNEKYGQIIGVNLKTNESTGKPTVIKYSREEEGKVFNFKFIDKEEGEESDRKEKV